MNNKKELWEYFFNKPKKHYNQYMYKLTEYPEYIIYDDEQMDNNKGKWSNYFGNDNPIYYEIGCGSGSFTVGNAERYPNRNYIALEIRFKRIYLGAKKSSKRGLTNLVFLRRRGEDLLDFIGKEEISGVYINFPDPWEGSEHKRIFSEQLFRDLEEVLKKDGKIFFKTDHYQYYLDVLELVKEVKGYDVVYHTDDLYNSPKIDENIQTEFEQMFLSKYRGEMNIKYIEISRV